MVPTRETLVIRGAYRHGILPSLLGREGYESQWRLSQADMATACLEQLIPIPPPNHVLTREKVLGEWQIADENDILVERET